jgi:hypothetical protein
VATSVLAELSYDAGVRALDLQERGLEQLRARTGVLLAASSLTASFLGAQTIQHESGLGVLGGLALVSLAASNSTTIAGTLWFVRIQRRSTAQPWKRTTLLLAGGIAVALGGCAQLTDQHAQPNTVHPAPPRTEGTGRASRSDFKRFVVVQARRSCGVERVGRGQDVAVQVGDEEHSPRSGLWEQDADIELAGRA